MAGNESPDGDSRSDPRGGSLSGRPRGVVEGPVWSLGWSRFFTVAAVALILLALWQFLALPSLGAARADRRADDAMQRAAASQDSEERDRWGLEGARLRDVAKDLRENRRQGMLEPFHGSFWLAVALFYIARRLRAKGARQLLEGDRRPPVVYLRSFLADEQDQAALAARRNFWTDEELLVKGLSNVGPVLAIGRPTERLRHSGAARLYVTQADWQGVARHLISNARLVVIRAGETPGIRWELARVREELPPEKVVLWIPRRFKGAAYAAFVELAREDLKVELPPDLHRHQIVTFGPDWRPRSAGSDDRAGDPFAPRSILQGLSHELRQLTRSMAGSGDGSTSSESLRKLLEQLEVRIASPPPFRLHPAAWIAIAVWLMLLVVVPGSRWSFGVDLFMREQMPILGAIVEGALAMLIGLGLGFWVYLRDPARYVRTSLVLCAVLAVDSMLVIARVPERSVMAGFTEPNSPTGRPRGANVLPPPASRETANASMRELCGKLLDCSNEPVAERESMLLRCVEVQTRPATNDDLRGMLVQMNRAVQVKCGALACDAFGPCYMEALREMGTQLGAPDNAPPLSAEKKRALVQLVCEASRDNMGRMLDITAADASPKTKQLRAAFEGLHNPIQVIDVMKEASAACAADDGRAEARP